MQSLTDIADASRAEHSIINLLTINNRPASITRDGIIRRSERRTPIPYLRPSLHALHQQRHTRRRTPCQEPSILGQKAQEPHNVPVPVLQLTRRRETEHFRAAGVPSRGIRPRVQIEVVECRDGARATVSPNRLQAAVFAQPYHHFS